MPQHGPLHSSAINSPFQLLPPDCDEFLVAGTGDVVDRAQRWAARERVLLFDGPAAHCVHALYRMDSCTSDVCQRVGFDHTQVWVDGRPGCHQVFLLTQPYGQGIPAALADYAAAHGLEVSIRPSDGWYGAGTVPIRLTIPRAWPLWPIERDVTLLLQIQPVNWEWIDEAFAIADN